MSKFHDQLKSIYPYKTELHTHSNGVSACSRIPAGNITRLYKSCGYTSVAVTNHFYFENIKNKKDLKAEVNRHFTEWENAKKIGDEIGINVIFGAELRFDGNLNDYLFFGADRDFYENLDLKVIHKLETFYPYAKDENRLLIQAHPFRNDMTRAPVEFIDGVEAFNLHKNHNSRVGVCSKWAEENNLLCTCGTDIHYPDDSPLCALLTKEPIRDARNLVTALKSGDVLWQIGAAILTF